MLSVLPINICVELDDPLEEPPEDELPEDEPPEDEPPEDEPPEDEPEPPPTDVPPGNVNVAPLVVKRTFPLRSVRYTVFGALESLANASDVGCP